MMMMIADIHSKLLYVKTFITHQAESHKSGTIPVADTTVGLSVAHLTCTVVVLRWSKFTCLLIFPV
jgi:hypothetical protein